MSISKKQSGFTYIELVIAISVLAIALTSSMAAIAITSRNNSDPMIRVQALAIANSLLEEIELMPFSFCDPNDANADIALSAADCVVDQDNGGGALVGPFPNTESRYSATDPFDNVADYGGFSMNAIYSQQDGVTPVPGMTGYSASVAISRVGTSLGLTSDSDALKITVTVNAPNGISVVISGFRTRYSPRSLM